MRFRESPASLHFLTLELLFNSVTFMKHHAECFDSVQVWAKKERSGWGQYSKTTISSKLVEIMSGFHYAWANLRWASMGRFWLTILSQFRNNLAVLFGIWTLKEPLKNVISTNLVSYEDLARPLPPSAGRWCLLIHSLLAHTSNCYSFLGSWHTRLRMPLTFFNHNGWY